MQWLLNWSMICNLMNILVAMCWRCGITHYARVCVVANNAVMARMAPGCYASFQLQLCCCNGGKAFLCHDHNNCAVTVEDYSYVVTTWHLLLQMTWHSSPRMCTWNWSYNMVLSTTSVGSVYIGSGGKGRNAQGVENAFHQCYSIIVYRVKTHVWLEPIHQAKRHGRCMYDQS